MVEYFLDVLLNKLPGPALKRPLILGVLTIQIKKLDIRPSSHFLARNESGVTGGVKNSQ